MNTETLKTVADSIVANGRGILAMDESMGTITKRFEALDIEVTSENRRIYRSLLAGCPGLGDFVSGAILFDETIRQCSPEGVPIPELLKRNNIAPGIKVDKKTHDLAGFPGEKITEGLDGLRDRLAEYRELGALFAKWRAVYTIGDGIPSATGCHANAHALARYAALCQEQGLVPIVEPEVLMNGAHDLERCYEVTSTAQKELFSELAAHGAYLEGTLLKPNMVIAGQDCPAPAGVDEVAEATVRCLQETAPPELAGVVFLSGGQSAQLATRHLNAMNREGSHPWPLSFSYGRALQNEAMAAWSGKPENSEAAQRQLLHRARCCRAACKGEYTDAMENAM